MRVRVLLAALAALSAMIMLLGCTSSGDGGRGGTNDYLLRGATVTPDSPTALEYVDLSESSGDADSTCVAVTANRVFDLFNASFTVSYDPTVLRFTGFDDAGTCVGTGNAVLPTLVDAATTPGAVVVGLSRNIANTSTGVSCGHLIDLCFDVIGEGDSRLAFTGNREIQDPTGAAIVVGWFGADVVTRL